MANRRDRKRIDAKGRNSAAVGRAESFLMMRRSLWQSPLVSALSPSARALMIELLSMFTGGNNGRLFLSLHDATDRLGFSDWRAAAAAFEELETVGLITMTLEAYFDVKTGIQPRARAWRLNWIGEDGERLAPEALPTIDERAIAPRGRKRLARRQSALKRYFKAHEVGKFTVVDSTTLDARSAEIVAAPTAVSTTLKIENGGKQPITQMGETTAHLSYQRGTGIADTSLPERIAARRARLRLAVIGNQSLAEAA